MKVDRAHIVFIERLSLWVWLGIIFPRLVLVRISRGFRTQCWVLEGRPFAVRLARAMGIVFGIRVDDLKYRMIDVRDEKGHWIYSRMNDEDLQVLLDEVKEEPLLQQICQTFGSSSRSL